MLANMRFRPKSRAARDQGYLPVPATFQRIRLPRSRAGFVLLAVVLLWFFTPFSRLLSRTTTPTYPKGRPFSSPHILESTSKYIYPPIEDAPLLKGMGRGRLVKEIRVRDANVPEVEISVIHHLSLEDDPDPVAQKQKEEAENVLSDEFRARNKFKNQDRVVFRPKLTALYPKAVIVTTVDYEKYSLEGLTKIVQNRVNYAHKQDFGVYVRWKQEFMPQMNSVTFLNDAERTKWVRLLCLRAAMFAFPEAEWFWFLDEDGLIMNLNVNLIDYILKPEALGPALLRERPVIPPNGVIKTYKNIRPELVRLVFTQSESKLETNSFLVKNDEVGRGILDIWTDKLFVNYNNFPYGPDSAISHIMQWHPYVLSKLGIIQARKINSWHPALPETLDHMHFAPGDFVVQWSDCVNPLSCEEVLNGYVAPSEK